MQIMWMHLCRESESEAEFIFLLTRGGGVCLLFCWHTWWRHWDFLKKHPMSITHVGSGQYQEGQWEVSRRAMAAVLLPGSQPERCEVSNPSRARLISTCVSRVLGIISGIHLRVHSFTPTVLQATSSLYQVPFCLTEASVSWLLIRIRIDWNL